MKKLFTTLLAVLFVGANLQAQIVINEILYNIPGNTEEAEFIELYNAGTTSVDLQNYTFTQGVTYTFTGGTIAPGGYFVVTNDSANFHNAFGMAPDAEWASGGLSNNGEDITIYDNNGNLIDSVDYDDGTPWPTAADGQGRSLQLCDHTTDNNLGTSWGTNNTQSGVVSTGDSLYATPGMMNVCVTVTPPPPASYPVYGINMINNVDTNGVADSTGITCELRGIVHCMDFRGGSGLDFNLLLSDNSAGIRVFSFNDVNNYTVTEGDSLHILGTIQQFGGLLQIAPDSIAVISQGNPTAMPMTITTLDESTENLLVTLENMMVVDTADWTGTGNGFNVALTNGTDTITMRVDNDVDLYNQPAIMGTFSVTGFGGQFDSSNPYTTGYQLYACSSNLITNSVEVESVVENLSIYPNPTAGALTIQTTADIQNIMVTNTLGQTVLTVNNVAATMTQINTADLDNGVYFITVITDNKMMTKQIQVLK